MTSIKQLNPAGLRIVLVLQGGGALGAYQAGVYHALHEHGLVPDWVVGTSIGAINAAILAGNDEKNRLPRLKQFWERVSHRDSIDMNLVTDEQRRSNIWLATLDTLVRGVPGFFKPRLFSMFPVGIPVKPEEASYYDTSELGRTLGELVDFDYMNQPGGMRLTVNALKVTCGSLTSFDSTEKPIAVEHILASGALPPGFPAVRVDGQLYWDGGMYSNTPLETVLDDLPHVDTLVFMVDLWSSEGPEPTTLDEVQTRQKDVTFASRSKRHIEDYVNTHKMQQKLRELYAMLPDNARNRRDAEELAALGCDSTMHIVRLPYAGRDWHMAAKDINFSKGSIEWRWEQGYQDAMRAIKAAGWLAFVTEDTPLVVHELPPYQRNAA
ncbi:patatin-like phospholipase family protein [Janthinobacterium agaricidamnosum]|uniref:Patatin-like phospholipase family protein n=1 Tax=Janthinobacterium agaricidamnosum NBRC 102515 = DSM 9628 TaxID=1349767 RepID=W0V901_9BURK|nr:patatin-like phospholipase family protein [Janthinobacterium agaricidamnosum]CDG84356.1 patatin-like phospholipase family protein [Janthinobacterium agaricidamnosum NBRC 102515 = DSM 9628]